MRFIIYIIVIMGLMLSVRTYAEEINVIANKSFPVNHISTQTLKEIYLGEKVTEGGIRIRPYDHKNPKIRRKFLTKVLGVSEDGYNAYWIKKVFQEGGIPPITKPSSDEIIRTVREDTGGIGYIIRNEADVSGVKILLTIDVGD
ncbi:MAG TPA: hypothetical protein DDX84_10635 [Nitrospiraceae bacterium]|nr:MAG: hypothetical protein A2035_00085 [Nitrospirae bacterium GWA2_42_11]HBI24633.1 hypothetical protein [Nitrospiraceae bacterium]